MGKVVFDRNGESGNIFFVLGMAFATLMEEGRVGDAYRMSERVQDSLSYENALKIIGEYVELEEEEEA